MNSKDTEPAGGGRISDTRRRATLSAPSRIPEFRPPSAVVRVDVAARSERGATRASNDDHYLAIRLERAQETMATSLSGDDIPEAFHEYGYAMLVALPEGYKPEQVAPALAAKIQTLPEALRRSLTWDQGPEMRDWKQVRIDAAIDVFFCDPHAPWQRGSNENTNGLLRQYFPKGFDFATVTAAELDAVADELNDRPRKRFAFATPTEQIAELLLQ